MKLYAHPFSSYCQKVLIVLYENATPFDYCNLEDPAADAALQPGDPDGHAVPQDAARHLRGQPAGEPAGLGDAGNRLMLTTRNNRFWLMRLRVTIAK